MDYHLFDADYIARLTAGDPATEDHFASYFGELLYRKLRTRLRRTQAIEDVRQETLLRVLAFLRHGGVVMHPERFGGFVNGFCNHVLSEYRRAENRHDGGHSYTNEPKDPAINLDRPLVTSQTKCLVRQVLSDLSAKDRRLLCRVYMDEIDKDEFCRRHNVQPEYLRVLLYRVMVRFRKAYDERSGRGEQAG